MHPNEVKITQENAFEYMGKAMILGLRHAEALDEQIKRQNVVVEFKHPGVENAASA